MMARAMASDRVPLPKGEEERAQGRHDQKHGLGAPGAEPVERHAQGDLHGGKGKEVGAGEQADGRSIQPQFQPQNRPQNGIHGAEHIGQEVTQREGHEDTRDHENEPGNCG